MTRPHALGVLAIATTVLTLLTPTSPAHAAVPLQPILSLQVAVRSGFAGTPQEISGSVMFADPYAHDTFPIDNGTTRLMVRPPGATTWRPVQAVSGDLAGATTFSRVTRLTTGTRYRLCYTGGRVVTYDAGGHEVDLRLARGCSAPVAVQVWRPYSERVARSALVGSIPGYHGPVAVQLRTATGGFRAYATATADAAGRFRVALRQPPRRTTWAYRFVDPGSGGFTSRYSAPVTIARG